jgi:hypothetical protein
MVEPDTSGAECSIAFSQLSSFFSKNSINFIDCFENFCYVHDDELVPMWHQGQCH